MQPRCGPVRGPFSDEAFPARGLDSTGPGQPPVQGPTKSPWRKVTPHIEYGPRTAAPFLLHAMWGKSSWSPGVSFFSLAFMLFLMHSVL